MTALGKGYFGPVISISKLKEGLDGDWVSFDRHGDLLDVEIARTVGPAAFLVRSVTDAVKRVEGDVMRSHDRDGMWAVDAIVLNRVVLQKLEDTEMTLDELIDAVRQAGFGWQISPVSAP